MSRGDWCVEHTTYNGDRLQGWYGISLYISIMVIYLYWLYIYCMVMGSISSLPPHPFCRRQKEKRIDFSILFPCNYYSLQGELYIQVGAHLYNLIGCGLLLCTIRLSCSRLFFFLYYFGFYCFLLGFLLCSIFLGSLFFFLLCRLGLRVSCKKGTE